MATSFRLPICSLVVATTMAMVGAGSGTADPPSAAANARQCQEALAALHGSLARYAAENRVLRGTLSARAWDEDGELLEELNGEFVTYHAPPDRFRVDVRVEDEDTTSYGTDGYRGWANDYELGVSVFDEAQPKTLALERDLFGVPSFEELELDERRLVSEEFSDGASCPVHGVTMSGVEVEGQLVRGDSTLRLSGRFPTFFGWLDAELRISDFRDGAVAYRTDVTTTEILRIEQSLKLESIELGVDDSQLPEFGPAPPKGE